MKKYFLVVFCAALLFVITGCGNKNQVKCTGETIQNDVTLKTELVADFDKSDKLTDATVVYELDSDEAASQYCALFKLMEDADKGISIDCSGRKVTIKGFANLESEDDEAEDESMIGMTKANFIKYIQEEEESLTCK